MDQPKPVTVLFLDSLVHAQQHRTSDKLSPHQDQINFGKPTKITLIRIPQPGKDLYNKHISITQSQTIKNFQIYFRNLEKTNGRYFLLTSNNQLLASSKDDILITPKQPIFTDMIIVKGNFTKITLCIYGNIINDPDLLKQKCQFFEMNAPVENLTVPLINMQGCEVFSTKDIFFEKSQVVNALQQEIVQENGYESWHQIGNDDGINEQQIENICNISQKLLNSFSPQNLMQQAFIVSFRTSLQEIYANLTKVFKSKHLGLYYSGFENVLNLSLRLQLSDIVRQALSLSLSDQFRALQVLKYLLQLKNHAAHFTKNRGVSIMISIFVQFFKIDSVVLSTFRILLLQVLISLAHWKDAAKQMVTKGSAENYRQLFTLEQIPIQKQIKGSRSRSRDKKKKQSKSEQRQSSENKKKKKKEKEGKKNKEKQRQRQRQRQKQKQKQKQKEKHKHKEGKQSKSKLQTQKKNQQQVKKFCPIADISFYQIILFMLNKQVNCKELILIKMLAEQIIQTMTKNKDISQRVAQSTCLLKDTKYLLSQGGEIINNKSLKFFAGCQPFLNSVQSEQVQIDLICEKEKLKKSKKFGLSPIKFKLMNKVLIDIAQSELRQNQFQTKNPYDEQFITIISYLIRSKSEGILYGFNKILDCFKIDASSDIAQLKKIQAAITMISQYIYKTLLSDQGAKTVMNIDQIHNSLISISSCLTKDPQVFTRQLKLNIMYLTNYAMAYDSFTNADGNFKVFADYFLRLFKFQFFEINKISEFKKRQFQKYNKSLNFEHLQEIFSLGNFHELLPDQPLLEIDVSLKIFIVLAEYNPNIWTQFYQYRLSSGFANLFNKISYMLLFLIDPSIQRQPTLTNIKKIQSTLQCYLTVINHLLSLLSKKCKYQSAFNELIQEDIFDDVDLYQRCLELYISLFNCLNQNVPLINQNSKKILKTIMKNILFIFDLLVQSYELVSHPSRQLKLKKMWQNIYIAHYNKISSRAPVLSLLAFFTKTVQNSAIKIFTNYFIEQPFKIQRHLVQKTCYIPSNQLSILQNVIRQNMFRADQRVSNNLNILLRNLLQKQSTTQKIASILDTIFDQVEGKFKELCPLNLNNINLIQIKKMQIFIQHLQQVGYVFKNKLQDKLLRFLKFVQAIKMEKQFMVDEKKIVFYQCQLNLIKIKNSLFQYFRKSLKQNKESNIFLSYLRIVSKNVCLSQNFLKTNPSNDTLLGKLQSKIEEQILKGSLILILTIGQLSCNPFNQSIYLYGQYLQKPYKPAYQINLIKIFQKLVENFQIINNLSASNESSLTVKYIQSIVIGICFILCQLTTIQGKQFFSTESRRNAIIGLISQEKELPFTKLELFCKIIPKQFIQTLKDYFAYPIIQKQLGQLTPEQKVTITKKISTVYSKSIFTMISEGDAVAKARYPLVGGVWKGGDISRTNGVYCPFRMRNYQENIQNYLIKSNKKSAQLQAYIFRTYKCSRPAVQINDLVFLHKKKKINKKVQKKIVQSYIKLVHVPTVLKNTQNVKLENPMYPKNRVSPLNQNNQPSSLNMQQSYGYQQNYSMNKVSPSPPVNRVTSQGLSPASISSVNNSNINMQPMQAQTYNYTTQSSTIPNLNPMGIENSNNSINRSHSSSLTRQPYNPTNASYNPNNNGEYYKGNSQMDRSNYSSPYKSSKSMETNFNNGYGNYQPRNNYGNNAYGERSGYQPNSFNYPPNREQYRNNNYTNNHGNNPNRYNSPGSNYNNPYNNTIPVTYPPQHNKPYVNSYNPNTNYPSGNSYSNPNTSNYPGMNYTPPVATNYPTNYNVPVTNYNPSYVPNVNANTYPPTMQTIGGVPTQFISTSSILNSQQQQLYVEAVLLFNQMLNPNLPQVVKSQKRLRLNQILVNEKVQSKLKQYISASKLK